MKNDTYERELRHWSEQEPVWRDLEGKTVMISGASGMVGRCLTDLIMTHNRLAGRGKETGVIALSRNEETARERFWEYEDSPLFRYVRCDINQGIPEQGGADYIIHGASNTHPLQYSNDPIGTIMTNVEGTRNLLEYGVSHKSRRFCFLSSVEIYGENRGDVRRFDESYLGYLDCNTLRAGYPEGKRLGEALCNAYREAWGMEHVTVRLSRIYGPTMREKDSKAIAQFIKRAAMGKDIVLKSHGKQEYSYTYVTDAAAGILYCLALGKAGEAYNVADHKSEAQLRGLAERLAETAGTKVVHEEAQEEERKGYSAAATAMLDGQKLEGLGWKARVHLEEGLASAVEGYREMMKRCRSIKEG